MLRNWPAHSRFASIALAGVVLVGGAGQGYLSAEGRGTSDEFNLIQTFTLSFIFAYWLEWDTRQTRLLRVWDRAWFFFGGWPVVLPYYMFKTRGAKRAFATIFGWLGLYVFVGISTVVLTVLLAD